MTDMPPARRPEAPSGGPEPRLERWFATELARAEADVKRGLVPVTRPGRVRGGPTGGRAAWVGLAASSGVAVLLVAALVGGFLGGGLGPSSSAAIGSPSPGIVIGAGGIPTSIDGAPVLTVGEGIARVAASTDATTFLVGGWLDYGKAPCPSAFSFPPSALLETGLCGIGPAMVGAPAYGPNGQGMVDWNGGLILWPVFLQGSSPPDPGPPTNPDTLNVAAVFRVHTHDPSAATCAQALRDQCDLAVVVDAVAWRSTTAVPPAPSPSAGLYADGIPATWDGQPVLRPTQAASVIQASTDATTFLVGGWITSQTSAEACPAAYGQLAEQELLPGSCPTYIEEQPGLSTPGLFSLHFRVPLTTWRDAGPAIIEVHTHDPAAGLCTQADQDACQRAVVVDQMVWDGPVVGSDGLPTWIDGQQPLAVPQAAARLATSTDSTPFFVRGWFDLVPLPCAYVPTPSGGAGLLRSSCPPIFIGPAPIPPTQFGAAADDISLVFPSSVDSPATGPVVLEIHGHDPGAARCSPALRAACEAAIIVDNVIWSASAGPSPSQSPSAAGGYPASIDGQPVIGVAAAQALMRTRRSPVPFLVGGYFETDIIQYCALRLQGTSDLIRECGAGDLAGNQGVDLWPNFLGSGPPLPPTGWTVLRVHVDDPRAAACPAAQLAACEAALIVDATVWSNGQAITDPTTIGPDGLPTQIDGSRVLRGPAATAWVDEATDDTSFLVGGWTPQTPEEFACPAEILPSPGATPDAAARLLPCGGLWFLDGPGDPQGVPLGTAPWVAVPIRVVSLTPPSGVPFVMRVHIHDPLAASCPATGQAACQRSIVEESLVWVGP